MVFDAATRAGARRVVSFSSVSAVGQCFQRTVRPPRYLPIDEDHPLEPQDAYINNAIVSLDSNVIVNSIATSAGGILTIGSSAPTTLVAVHGTNLNAEDTSSVASGNLGDIVHPGELGQLAIANAVYTAFCGQ